MKRLIYFLFLAMFLNACSMENKNAALQQWKAEVVSTEEAFARMAEEKGMDTAFLHFAAEDAVLQRGNAVIKGKEDIRTYFGQQTLQEVVLKWHPDFVDVAASGDMAYTYGKYTFSAVDTSGAPLSANGIFHTVWKRQPNGEWKYVWD